VDARLLSGVTVLATVVERGSFTKAAELLGLSASGVSRAISRLEQRLGVRLLDRTTRTLRLTAEGARLNELAAPHLTGIEEAASSAAGAAFSAKGTVRASLNPFFASHILAPSLPEFKQRYPELSLVLVQSPDAGGLIAEGVDIAVRFGPQPPSTMSSRRLLETRVLTVAAPSYLSAHSRPASPEALAGHDCIQYLDPQRGKPFEWEFRRAGETRPVNTSGRLTLADVDTMIAACVAGAGIAQVLALSVEALVETGTLIELFPDWPGETFPLFAIRPSRRLPAAKVTAFLDFCTEICGRVANPSGAGSGIRR
jgi:DNA-binding transcriptional LysR family regulator